MTIDENKAIARRFVTEVWNEQDLEAVNELYSPDYVGHWFRPDGEDVDRAGLKEFIGDVHHAFPDYQMDIEFIHGEGDLVTFGFTGSGTHEREYMGIPPSNEEVPGRPIPGHVTLKIEGDRIVEGWATWDALGLLRAMGALPADMSKMAPAADD